jgi:membrane fusion protein (multidrug efflux system)
VRLGDAVVVDVLDLPAGVQCRDLSVYLDQAEVFAVVGDGMIDAAWFAVAAHARVQVVVCDDESRSNGFAPAVQALQAHLGGPSPEELARRVLELEPSLKQASELVVALCRQPWRVRRPADIAIEAAVSAREVAGRSQSVGFGRTEHFLSAVRLVAHECLVKRYRMSSSRAWASVGVTDLSNFRKQAARARRGAPSALDWAARGVPALLLCLGALLQAGCHKKDANAGAASDAPAAGGRGDSTVALPVVGALVRRGDLVLSVRATGAVRAERLVTLKAETQGTVSEVAVRPGDRVERGQVLARLDPRPFDIAVQEAEASLAESRMRFQEALIGDDPADTSATAVLRRQGARLRAGMGGAEARLDRARLDRERASTLAPFGGVVDRVGVVAGQRIGPGDEIARIVDLGSLTVEASVLEHDLPFVRPGGRAGVVPSASPDTRYAGTILAVLPVVDTTTRAGRVLVGVRTADGRLRPGMYADVDLEAARLVGRVLVPAGAVIERDGRTLVFRARAGRAEWVYVPVGRSNGTETEILPDSVSRRTPVAPGDTVLVGGHLTLTHDAPIRVRLQEGGRNP